MIYLFEISFFFSFTFPLYFLLFAFSLKLFRTKHSLRVLIHFTSFPSFHFLRKFLTQLNYAFLFILVYIEDWSIFDSSDVTSQLYMQIT